MQTKNTVRNEQAQRECRFLLVDTQKHLTSIAVLAVHTKTSLLYTFQRSIKLIEIYIYARKKHPSSGYPAANHSKHSKFAITDIREKPVNFFYNAERAST